MRRNRVRQVKTVDPLDNLPSDSAGKIQVEPDGRLDPVKADRARANNLKARKGGVVLARHQVKQPTKGTSPEFLAGAQWMATQICTSARNAWPEFVAGLKLDLVPEAERRGKGGTGTMRAVTRRIAKLENQLGTSEGTPRILYLVCKAGTTQADMAPDIQILRESGFLPTGRLGLVDFGRIPRGLNAEERENFLRERGSEICFPQCKALTSWRVRCS